jgi:hypothetical protein
MVIQTDEIRVKIDEKEQKEIFEEFAKKFKNKKKAADYLNISKHNFNDYSHCWTRYIPEKIITKIIRELRIKEPKIIDKKTLKQVWKGFIGVATEALKKKYGDKWKKVLNKDSKKALLKKYGKDAYNKIAQKGHKSSEQRYGKNWRRILSQKGVEALKKRYGAKWYDTTLKKGRERLKEKYGDHWQKELSKLAMISLRKKHIKNFEKRRPNIKFLFSTRGLTTSEKLITDFLNKGEIPFKTHIIKNNLEFDIVIPDEYNTKYVIEVSNIKPTTYTQRMKILKLYYQKLTFPSAQHIAILRSKYSKNGKEYGLHKIIKSFLDKEKITLLSLENIDKYIGLLINYIKENRRIDLKENFLFNKRAISNSKKGCITQAKKINKDESKLNSLLLNIGASVKGPCILEIKDGAFICVDNFEDYKGNKIAYEINSSNQHNSLRALAGKIILVKKFNEDIKFIVILNNSKIFNNSSFQFLKDLSDCVILKKDFNEPSLREIRKNVINQSFVRHFSGQISQDHHNPAQCPNKE